MAKKGKSLVMEQKIYVPDGMTEEDVYYISECQKRFRFFIDLPAYSILIPKGEDLTDDENLICEHLYNRFGIDSVFSENARIIKLSKIHEQSFGSKKKEVKPEAVDIMTHVKIGLIFDDTRKGLKHQIMKEIGKTKWSCRVIDSMLPDWQMEKASFEIGVRNGLFVFEVNLNQTKID